MSGLDGFKTFCFKEGTPWMSITSIGVTFSKGVYIKLGKPDYIRVLINEGKKMIAAQAAEKNTPLAIEYKPSRTGYKRLGHQELKELTAKMAGIDPKVISARVQGTLNKAERAILFDLSKAEKLN